MLPESLYGRYKRYKEDTTVFATWLFNTAKACGYVAPSSPVEIEADTLSDGCEHTKHVLPTREIRAQATVIAASTRPKIKVPLVIQGVLHRAIVARKRCSVWFREASAAKETTNYDEANLKHEHFIKTLERAFDILQPRFELSSSQSQNQARQASGNNLSESGSGSIPANRFEGLEVEDIDDEHLDITASDPITAAPNIRLIRKVKSKTDDVWELDLTLDEDLPFIIYCFYEDLNRIRKFIEETWEDYAKGRLDLLTAAATTNLAIGVVQTAEKELMSLCPNRLGKVPSYEAITSIIYPIPSLHCGTQGNISAESSKLDDMIYVSTFLSLRKCSDFLKIGPGSVPAVSSMESVLSTIPGISPNSPCWYEEDKLLSQLLLDLEIKRLNKSIPLEQLPEEKRQTFPIEDEITKGLQAVLNSRNGGDIGVWVVFAARILLDVQKVLGHNVAGAYMELRQRAAVADAMLGFTHKNQADIWGYSGDKAEEVLTKHWGPREEELRAKKLAFSISVVLKGNNMVRCKQIFFNGEGVPNTGYLVIDPNCHIASKVYDIYPSPDLAFFYNHNPVYCGMEALKIAVKMEKVGVSLANTCCSFVAVAHLYNAARQMDLVKKNSWPAVERVTELNIRQLFRGQLPNLERTIFSRFQLVTNMPLHVFAAHHRAAHINKPDWNKTTRKGINVLHSTEISGPLDTYIEGLETGEKLLLAVSEHQNIGKSYSKRDRSRIGLLQQFKEALPQFLPRIETEYIRISRQSNILFLRISRQVDIEFQENSFPPGQDWGGGFELANLNTIMDIYRDAFMTKIVEDRDSGRGRKKKLTGTLQNPGTDRRRLEIAANEINKFLPEANRPLEVRPFEVVYPLPTFFRL
jgi:hypothetical protein